MAASTARFAFGLVQPRRPKRSATNQLERRLPGIDKRNPNAKSQLTQLLDSFIEGEKFERRVGSSNAG
ncbi:hypothetical protein SBBP1_1300006 [Burkholderiales bacterium]|nr:hypothetical protein SBBP1_1300006 [Burkholderiales bacterium]